MPTDWTSVDMNDEIPKITPLERYEAEATALCGPRIETEQPVGVNLEATAFIPYPKGRGFPPT